MPRTNAAQVCPVESNRKQNISRSNNARNRRRSKSASAFGAGGDADDAAPSTSKSPTAGTSKSPTAGTSKSPTAGPPKSSTAGTSKFPTAGTSKFPTAGPPKSPTAAPPKSRTAVNSKSPAACPPKSPTACTWNLRATKRILPGTASKKQNIPSAKDTAPKRSFRNLHCKPGESVAKPPNRMKSVGRRTPSTYVVSNSLKKRKQTKGKNTIRNSKSTCLNLVALAKVNRQYGRQRQIQARGQDAEELDEVTLANVNQQYGGKRPIQARDQNAKELDKVTLVNVNRQYGRKRQIQDRDQDSDEMDDDLYGVSLRKSARIMTKGITSAASTSMRGRNKKADLMYNNRFSTHTIASMKSVRKRNSQLSTQHQPLTARSSPPLTRSRLHKMSPSLINEELRYRDCII